MRSLCARLFLLPVDAVAQQYLKNTPDPDPEKQRATFRLPKGAKVNLFAMNCALRSLFALCQHFGNFFEATSNGVSQAKDRVHNRSAR